MIRAIVTDDSPATRRILISILKRISIEIVAEADNADQAVAACLEHTPDLMFLDVVMPGETGVDVLRRMRAQESGIGVIMVTSVSDRDIVECCREQGAIGYILKPFRHTRIVADVTRLCVERGLLVPPPTSGEDPTDA